MAKPQKGSAVKTDASSATGADDEQQSGTLPQEQSSDATDTTQPDANAGTGAADGTGSGEGTDEDADQPLAGQTSADAAGTGAASLSGDMTDADDDQPEPLPDNRVPVRFTGPWKSYSRGDVTKLQPEEANTVIRKELAERYEE